MFQFVTNSQTQAKLKNWKLENPTLLLGL